MSLTLTSSSPCYPAIWKFPIAVGDSQTIDMPTDAKVLAVQVQNGTGPCLWAMCDPQAPKRPRTFETFGTGHPVPPAPREYIGTYQLRGGGLIFHVFERSEVYGGFSDKANARRDLMASAPELRRLLSVVLDQIDGDSLAVQFFDLRLIEEIKATLALSSRFRG